LAFPSQQPVEVWLDALRGRIYQASLHFDANGPVYHQEPGLGLVTESLANRDVNMRLLASSTLSSYLAETIVDCIPPQVFTPAVMVQAREQYGERFLRSWREVRPYYLQEPSITLKKAKQT
jgi:hypothetical protein